MSAAQPSNRSTASGKRPLWRRIAESLLAGDPRIASAVAAARDHAGAALPHVIGDEYTVEHWLACYAVLMLS